MADRSNYADKSADDSVLNTPEYALGLYEARRCAGDGRAGAGEGPSLSALFERSLGGDWSWKPERNRVFPPFAMPALSGVQPARGAAERFRGETFVRS